MNEICEHFENLRVNTKKCVICDNIYILIEEYHNSDIICNECNKNYESFMNEESNDDGTKINNL
jgi:hypothetical protein